MEMGHLCILLRRPAAKAGLTAPSRQEGRNLKLLITYYVASPVLGTPMQTLITSQENV